MSLCGNSECGASSGLAEEPTFGQGKLDFNGYWEIPCGICARKWEELFPGEIAWPFTQETREKIFGYPRNQGKNLRKRGQMTVCFCHLYSGAALPHYHASNCACVTGTRCDYHAALNLPNQAEVECGKVCPK